jgi:hypothetical protein
MNVTFCHAWWRDQPTTTIWWGPRTDIVPKGEVRAVISWQFMSSAEPQTRLFWG